MTRARLRLGSRTSLVCLIAALLGAAGCSGDGSVHDETSGAASATGGGASTATGGDGLDPSGSYISGASGGGNPAAGYGDDPATGAGNHSATGGASPGIGGGSMGDEYACPGLPPEGDIEFEACGGVSHEAEYLPADVFIMLDRSVSMTYEWGNTIRWEMLTDAIRQFVSSPEVAHIGIGIQFFSQSGLVDDTMDCNVDNYATAAVEIGPAAEVGADVVAAIEDTPPAGLTPTVPALEGAIQYVYERNRSGGKRPTVALLVTDGLPTQCPDDVVPADIEAVAAAGVALDPPVRTYVIGIEAGFNLDGIARAGGTRGAYLIEEGAPAERFRDVMLNITDAQLSCEFDLPAAPDHPMVEVDPELVMMIYQPAHGEPEEIPKANSPSECAHSTAGGWYYDNPNQPTKIRVCPCTCNRLGAGQLTLMVGCKPREVSLR
jgi:hypothetical protein